MTQPLPVLIYLDFYNFEAFAEGFIQIYIYKKVNKLHKSVKLNMVLLALFAMFYLGQKSTAKSSQFWFARDF